MSADRITNCMNCQMPFSASATHAAIAVYMDGLGIHDSNTTMHTDSQTNDGSSSTMSRLDDTTVHDTASDASSRDANANHDLVSTSTNTTVRTNASASTLAHAHTRTRGQAKKHCRVCGQVYCGACSPKVGFSGGKLVRMCKGCVKTHLRVRKEKGLKRQELKKRKRHNSAHQKRKRNLSSYDDR